MTSNRDLTILLTLKDRAAFTNRWLNYANNIAFPFKVLIADGGRDESVPAMLSDKARYPNVDFEYIQYPYDRNYSDYYAKLSDALRRVQSPFVALADNDDFFVVNTLKKAVQFLSVNPDYVSCGGQGAIFWIEPSNHDECRLYGKNINWKYARIHSVTGKTARERIRSQPFSSTNPCYYDVTRIEDARMMFEIVRDLDLNDLFLHEDLVQFLTAIAGKTKRLEYLYLARQHNPPSSSASTHKEKFGDQLGRMFVDSWSVDFAKFVNAVAACLAAADSISIGEARDFVISSYRSLAAPSLLSVLLDEHTIPMTMPIIVSIVRSLVRLPDSNVCKIFIRKLYRSFRWISPDSVYGWKMFGRPVPSSSEDFQSILEFLTSPR